MVDLSILEVMMVWAPGVGWGLITSCCCIRIDVYSLRCVATSWGGVGCGANSVLCLHSHRRVFLRNQRSVTLRMVRWLHICTLRYVGNMSARFGCYVDNMFARHGCYVGNMSARHGCYVGCTSARHGLAKKLGTLEYKDFLVASNKFWWRSE